MNNFEMNNHKKDYVPTSDKKPGNPGSFLDVNGGGSKNKNTTGFKSDASTKNKHQSEYSSEKK